MSSAKLADNAHAHWSLEAHEVRGGGHSKRLTAVVIQNLAPAYAGGGQGPTGGGEVATSISVESSEPVKNSREIIRVDYTAVYASVSVSISFFKFTVRQIQQTRVRAGIKAGCVRCASLCTVSYRFPTIMLFCIIFEIKRDIGRKLQFFHAPAFDVPLRWLPS